ncbi:MAG: hypothetical protein M1826_004548 [Phylliscum demangeonii]|nr:MAG: hypothetical protein M1826_004548 [Phylliscum demangeonii]
MSERAFVAAHRRRLARTFSWSAGMRDPSARPHPGRDPVPIFSPVHTALKNAHAPQRRSVDEWWIKIDILVGNGL